MQKRMPFLLRGIDTDNGHEFINHHLLEWVRQSKDPSEFTRSRARKKNDNAHVEQKNSTHVREQLGYDRFDCPELEEPMQRFYESYELFRNLFIPCFKILRKERVGAKVRKIYGPSLPPCERLLQYPDLAKERSQRLRELRDRYDPIDLSKEVQKRKNEFFKAVQDRGWVPVTTGSDELVVAHSRRPCRTPTPLDSQPSHRLWWLPLGQRLLYSPLSSVPSVS